MRQLAGTGVTIGTPLSGTSAVSIATARYATLAGFRQLGQSRGNTRGAGHMSVASRASSLARRWARRLLSLLEEPFIRVRRTRTMRQSARGKPDTSKRWRRRRSMVTILEISSYLGAIALVDVGFLIPLLSVALASAIFLFYRLRHVTSPVVRKAKTKPHQLVETATPDIGEIVGRDQLCRVIMEDIHHSDTRRPHLLVGGVGAGKTAVLVKLTRLFAEHGAVPVPIRLRDATDGLNFREMAHTRFLAL